MQLHSTCNLHVRHQSLKRFCQAQSQNREILRIFTTSTKNNKHKTTNKHEFTIQEIKFWGYGVANQLRSLLKPRKASEGRSVYKAGNAPCASGAEMKDERREGGPVDCNRRPPSLPPSHSLKPTHWIERCFVRGLHVSRRVSY